MMSVFRLFFGAFDSFILFVLPVNITIVENSVEKVENTRLKPPFSVDKQS